MSRQGVLSDLAIKQIHPENYPLDVGGQEMIHPIHLQKNIFKGIKPPKRTKRFTDVARFPVNDLKNFSQFGSSSRSQEAEFMAIMNYRNELGSSNVPTNMQTAFQERNSAGHIPIPMIRPELDTGGVQPPATLSLGKLQTDRMKNTLNLIAEPEDHAYLQKENETHDETLSRLNKIYRDDPEQLGHIERAWNESGKQAILE